MKKVILDLAVSLDGFIEGPNGEIDWCIMDDDMNFNRFLESVDTIFYGRASYDAWEIISQMPWLRRRSKAFGRRYMKRKNMSSPLKTGKMLKQPLFSQI
ncbi:hypothetical protein LWM68_42535 [Niabella sp. W65]|nr:hypothetical protein [Niabella sp. W65]MCH7368824.1 hypothetical protein [Niabella sp. W65]ULT44395.1 hypothetical protein KRR40_14220 [Niabella sp. I65]